MFSIIHDMFIILVVQFNIVFRFCTLFKKPKYNSIYIV